MTNDEKRQEPTGPKGEVESLMRAATAARGSRTAEEIEAFERQHREQEQRSKVAQLVYWLKLPSKEAHLITYGTDREGRPWRETEAWKRIEDAIKRCLVIVLRGANGTGKSSAACGILADRCQAAFRHPNGTLERADSWDGGYYLRAPDYCRMADWEEDRLEEVWSARNLVIDDLGEESELGDKAVGKMRALLTKRDDAITPDTRTIITTNLSREEIAGRYGSRVFDRLRELAVLIHVTETVRPTHGK